MRPNQSHTEFSNQIDEAEPGLVMRFSAEGMRLGAEVVRFGAEIVWSAETASVLLRALSSCGAFLSFHRPPIRILVVVCRQEPPPSLFGWQLLPKY